MRDPRKSTFGGFTQAHQNRREDFLDLLYKGGAAVLVIAFAIIVFALLLGLGFEAWHWLAHTQDGAG